MAPKIRNLGKKRCTSIVACVRPYIKPGVSHLERESSRVFGRGGN